MKKDTVLFLIIAAALVIMFSILYTGNTSEQAKASFQNGYTEGLEIGYEIGYAAALDTVNVIIQEAHDRDTTHVTILTVEAEKAGKLHTYFLRSKRLPDSK